MNLFEVGPRYEENLVLLACKEQYEARAKFAQFFVQMLVLVLQIAKNAQATLQET